MGTGLKVFLGLSITFLLFAGLAGSSVIGINNDLVSQEKSLEAQYEQDQNNYDNFVKKVLEVSQVPAMARDDLEKVTKAAISGRYGADGSKAVFQMIREQNPNVSESLYTKIQQVVDAGRTSFEAEQKMLIDKKRVYLTNLDSFPTNLVAKFLGFPKIDLSKIGIVTSDRTDEAFKTKKDKPINLRDGQ